jgi:hypothetical protein
LRVTAENGSLLRMTIRPTSSGSYLPSLGGVARPSAPSSTTSSKPTSRVSPLSAQATLSSASPEIVAAASGRAQMASAISTAGASLDAISSALSEY